jgi:Na+-translocating ferredoxin:NAD+ oxidoreductase RnfG subunit
MDNPILYIIIAAIAGIIFGKLDTVFTNNLKKNREAKKEQALHQEIEQLTKALEQAREQARQQVSVPQPEGKSALRIAQSESGVWVVEIDGVPTRPETISVEQRTRLIALLTQARPLVEAKPLSLRTTQPLANPESVPPAPSSPASMPPQPASSASSQPNLPPSPMRANLISGMRAMMDTKKTDPAPGLLSVVALIDEVLQKQIAGTPLASRQIRLEQGATGEVLVHVGTTRYPGIDSVPDPEIQAAIRNAIAEFNKSN